MLEATTTRVRAIAGLETRHFDFDLSSGFGNKSVGFVGQVAHGKLFTRRAATSRKHADIEVILTAPRKDFLIIAP